MPVEVGAALVIAGAAGAALIVMVKFCVAAGLTPFVAVIVPYVSGERLADSSDFQIAIEMYRNQPSARVLDPEVETNQIRPALDLIRAGSLEFQEPDAEAFPCLELAYRALESGPSLAVVLNAANEVAVEMFLDGRLGFTAIPRVIERAMNAHQPVEVQTLAEVRNVDRWAREYSHEAARGIELSV